MKRKLGNCTQVTVYGSLSVITTLEFLEHHFAKVGHMLLMTQPYPFTHTADTKHAKASAATRLRCVLGMLSSLEVKVLWPT